MSSLQALQELQSPYDISYQIASLPFVVKPEKSLIEENFVPHAHVGFKNFIINLLHISKVPQQLIDQLTNNKSMIFWTNAFTAPSYSANNYEFYELLGDSTLNCCIVFYLKTLFPQLCNALGVKYLSRLKIDYVSKSKFSSYASKLNFDQFIRCGLEDRSNGKVKRSLAEDCLESFAGCLMTLCDQIEHHSGYKYCYNFIENILNREKISLNQEDLFDPKSRLKELFDVLKNHELIYKHNVSKCAVKRQTTFTTQIWVKSPDGSEFLSAQGVEFTKKTSEQIAAKCAIEDLKKRKIFKNTFVDTLNVSS